MSIGKVLFIQIYLINKLKLPTITFLHFISNPYIHVPYAAGKFDFVIPYEKIPGLKEEYLYDTGLLHSSMLGESITSDLDGNGQEDTIMFAVANPFATYMATEEVTETTFTLEINGTDFTDDFMNAVVYMTDNISNHYYVVDLDTSDNYKELLIVDYDYNDNNRSLFYWYQIKAKDDQIYYLYLTDFLTVPNQDIDMNAQDIFENLLLAG